MLDRAFNLVRYRLGEFLLRGTFQRVLVMIALVVGVAAAGGLLAYTLDQGFQRPEEAVWWAFLRLSDPGYLGDDEGAARRSVSLVLTVAGYVLFMGAMVAIMTQWLHHTVRELESGRTPIAARGHVVIAGWTDRTVSILREMFFDTGRQTSMWQRGGQQLAVVLAEDASPELHQNLRDRMGARWRKRQIILREGEPIHLHHLRRADFAHAAAILLPGDPYQDEGNADSDVRIIKTIASIGRHALPFDEDTPRPFLVAELFDGRRTAVARSMYDGPMALVCSGRLVAGLLVQSLRFARLSVAVRELLFADDQDRLRIVAAPEEALSRSFFDVARSTEKGSVVGVVRDGEAIVCPEPDTRIRERDALVVYGPTDEISVGEAESSAIQPKAVTTPPMLPLERVLVLGWTRRVPALLQELMGQGQHVRVEVLSMVRPKERVRDLIGTPIPKGRVKHRVGDFTIPSVLARLDLKAFDAVLLIGSDRYESGSESDARSLSGLAALRTLLPAHGPGPRVLTELMDAENAEIVEGLGADFIVTPMVVGRVLAQVALTPRLSDFFDDVFTGGGGEVVVVSPALYGTPEDLPALRRAAFEAGHLPLGVLDEAGTLLPFEQASMEDCRSIVVLYRRSPERRASSVPDEPGPELEAADEESLAAYEAELRADENLESLRPTPTSDDTH